MQIIKFNSIENLGIFKKFPKNAEGKNFEKYNLIYGWNGSGKTTFSRLFQFIEWGANCDELSEKQEHEFYKCLNAEIITNDTTNNSLKITNGLTGQTETIKTLNVRVFNSVFIENNIDWDGKTKEITIGEDVKDTKTEIEDINKIITKFYDSEAYKANKPIYIKPLKERYEAYVEKITQFSDEEYLTETASKIYAKAAQGTMYNNNSQKSNYNKADLKRFFAQNPTKELIQSKTDLKIDAEVDILSTEIKSATEKPIFTYNFDLNTFNALFFLDIEQIKTLINENIVSTQAIKELTENTELQEWVKDGFFNIHDKDDKICKFCGGVLEGVFERLGNHFDTKFMEHEKSLKSRIKELENIKLLVNNLYTEIPKSDNLLQNYKEKYNKFQNDTLLPLKTNFFLNIDILVKALQLKLEGKKKESEEKIKEYKWTNLNFSELLKTAHNLINDNNLEINNFSKSIEVKQEKVEAYYTLKVFDTYIKNQTNKAFFEHKKELILEIQEKKCLTRIKELQKQKSEKEALLTNTLIGAKDINKLLFGFWGDKIELKPAQNGYQILRKSHNGIYIPAKNMSDGEKTVMAFCYFIISLKSKKSDQKNNKIEDTIIVIDDPISSLADNYIYQIYSHIQNDFDNAKQLFILSHNFYFINLLKRWLFKKKRPEDKNNPRSKQVKNYKFLMIKDNYKDGDFTPLLSDVNNLLGKFHSEYHFLYVKLLEAKNNFELENSYGIPNMLRQFIETFLSFKIPNGTTSLEEKMITLKKNSRITDISNEQIAAIARYVDFNSHREKIEAINNFTDILQSSKTILNDTFTLLIKSDPHHFSELDNCINLIS